MNKDKNHTWNQLNSLKPLQDLRKKSKSVTKVENWSQRIKWVWGKEVSTWRRGTRDGGGGAVKVTGGAGGSFLLVVTVDGDVAVAFDGVRLETSSVLLDLGTVSSCSTSVIYGFLKHLLVPVFAHTIRPIFSKFPPKYHTNSDH